MSKEEYKNAIEVSVIFHEGQRMFAVPKQSAQPLPFGVGGGLVAIKTLLSRDPCGHANTAIQMIDAILAEQPAQQEPVAWLHKVTKLMVHADEIAKTSRNEDRINSGEFQALYTSPPAPHRKPLTDEEIGRDVQQNT